MADSIKNKINYNYLDRLLDERNLSCLGESDRDLDRNLLGGTSLISPPLGPSLLAILLSLGGEERNLRLSSKPPGPVRFTSLRR